MRSFVPEIQIAHYCIASFSTHYRRNHPDIRYNTRYLKKLIPGLHEFLKDKFPERRTGRYRATQWPPRSSDITPQFFFLLRLHKEQNVCNISLSYWYKVTITDVVSSVIEKIVDNTWLELYYLDFLRDTKGFYIEIF